MTEITIIPPNHVPTNSIYMEVPTLVYSTSSSGEEMYIQALYVPKGLRKNGYGKKLMLELVEVFNKGGYKSIHVNASPFDSNQSLHDLKNWYYSLGFISKNGEALLTRGK